VPAIPSLNVPEVRLSVPVDVNWNPPSFRILFDVTFPIVRVVVTITALESETPVELLMVKLFTVAGKPVVA